jgi:hypothetical protein
MCSLRGTDLMNIENSWLQSSIVPLSVCEFEKLRKVTLSFVMSVRPSVVMQLGCHWRNFHEISIQFQNLSRKFKYHSNRTRIKSTLHEDRYTCLIISRSVVLKIKNVLNKCCRENQNTRFVFSKYFFEIRAVCEIMWENIVQRARNILHYGVCALHSA